MHRFFTIWTECLGRCVGFTKCFFQESPFGPIPLLKPLLARNRSNKHMWSGLAKVRSWHEIVVSRQQRSNSEKNRYIRICWHCRKINLGVFAGDGVEAWKRDITCAKNSGCLRRRSNASRQPQIVTDTSALPWP